MKKIYTTIISPKLHDSTPTGCPSEGNSGLAQDVHVLSQIYFPGRESLVYNQKAFFLVCGSVTISLHIYLLCNSC